MKHSIEDLLKIAEGKSAPTTHTNLENDVQRFILSLKIKEGAHPIKNGLLYKAYSEWSAKPLRAMQFHMEFAKFFIQSRAKTYRYYLLNYRPIELLNKVDNMKVRIK